MGRLAVAPGQPDEGDGPEGREGIDGAEAEQILQGAKPEGADAFAHHEGPD